MFKAAKANELDLLIKLLSYNLYERFKRDCYEPVHQGYTIARFRLEFFHSAATIILHSRRIILKLVKDFVIGTFDNELKRESSP